MNLSQRPSPVPPPSVPQTAPEVVARLEALDDVIFPAIEGDPQAVNLADQAWSSTVADVGAQAVEESRRQYLRYARSTWELLKSQTVRNPWRLAAVLKIIGLLVGDDV